jgi:hypothetical protein
MARKRYTAEEIIGQLRTIEIQLRSGWVLCRTSMVSPSRTETMGAVTSNERDPFMIETDTVSVRSISRLTVS